ncbi:MAG: class I SAM-dependent methyltransferase [Myxococcota bacterium]|nr:class I SAM-dependent methyltransferase [Myxococcota bacterium]
MRCIPAVTDRRAERAGSDARVVAEQRERYDDFYGRRRWRFRIRWDCRQRRYVLPRVLARLGVPLRDRAVLDVGFGSGDLLMLAHPSCRVCGVEISRSAIEQARSAATRAGYREFDFRKPLDDGALPYPDACFDVAICSHVLEHVPDDRAALSEIRRVLRPGGVAVVFVPVEPQGFDPKHRRTYGAASLAELASEAGLRPTNVQAQNRWAWPLRFMELPDLHGGGSWAALCDGLQHVLAAPLAGAIGAALDAALERIGVPGTQVMLVAVPDSPVSPQRHREHKEEQAVALFPDLTRRVIGIGSTTH